MHRNITPSTLQRFNRANPTLPDDNHDHGQSEQSDKNEHGHGDHSDKNYNVHGDQSAKNDHGDHSDNL